jgi:hypothetical protein
MSLVQKLAIPSPATGLLVYQTDGVPGFYYYSGSGWVFNGSGSQWTTSGANIYFNTGNVAIGSSSTPNYALTIGAASNPLFLSGVQEGSGLDSILLISGGVVKKRVYTATASTNAWSLTGNTGQTNTYNSGSFIGTSDANNLRFRTDNTHRMLISSTGNVGIGANPVFATAAEKLLVDAGTTTSYNVISGKGTINNYLQLNIQNLSNGTNASSDIVATANDGSETNYYVDLGINSSGNTSGYFGGARDAYLYNLGEDFLIGTGTANKSLKFLTGGSSETTNTRMIINGSGNVGIGTSSPSYKLHINAASNPLAMNGIQTGTSSDSLLTISGSVVRKFLPTTSVSNVWALGGNAVPSIQKLGTTSAFALPFITSNVERMRLHATGNLGIGSLDNDDAANEAKVEIVANANQYTGLSVVGDTDDYFELNVQNLGDASGGDSSTDIVATASDGDEDENYINMGINSASYRAFVSGNSRLLNGPHKAYIYATGKEFYIGNSTGDEPLVFFTNSSTDGDVDARGKERMRISGDDGEVHIGDISDNIVDQGNYLLQVNGDVYMDYLNYNGSFNRSDRRLKTNLAPLNYGLNNILRLNPVSYNWAKTPGTDKQLGLIAQEVRTVVPEIVRGDESKEMLSVNYTALIPVLINAIKEQQKQIDDLKLQVEKLQK